MKLQQLKLPLFVFFAFSLFSSLQFHTLLMEKELGYSEIQIGNLLMGGALMNLLTPFWVRFFQKKLPYPGLVLSLNLFGMGLLFFLLPLPWGYQNTFLLFLLFNLCGSSCFILISTLLLFASEEKSQSYFFKLRSIGTLGFASFCFLGWQFGDLLSLETLYRSYGITGILVSLLSFGVIKTIPSEASLKPVKQITKLLFEKTTLQIILCLALTNLASFVASQLLGNLIYEKFQLSYQAISQAWTVATFAEIPLIWISIFLLKKGNLKWLIALGMFLCFLRMSLSSMAQNYGFFLGAQIFHGFFYGVSLSAFGLYLKEKYEASWLHSLNLFSSLLITGISSAFGGKIAGILWHHFGLSQVYLWGALLALACFLWMLFFVPKNLNLRPNKPQRGPL